MAGKKATNAASEKELAQKYVQAGGVKCPFCDSQDIEGGSVEIDSGRAYQKVSCHKCGKAWHDGYTLDSLLFEGNDDFTYPNDPHAPPKGKGK